MRATSARDLAGHMPDRTTAGRDCWEYHPNSGAGQRDKYTGTLGHSGLADAGTTTRGPDECAHRHPPDMHNESGGASNARYWASAATQAAAQMVI